MGFSALDGLVMAKRCGSLDPEVILYLGRQGHSFADFAVLAKPARWSVRWVGWTGSSLPPASANTLRRSARRCALVLLGSGCGWTAPSIPLVRRISTSDSIVEVRVIATDEELMIARHTQKVIEWSVS
jgi:hypothetical protein